MKEIVFQLILCIVKQQRVKLAEAEAIKNSSEEFPSIFSTLQPSARTDFLKKKSMVEVDAILSTSS